MKKRTAALLLALILAFGLAACGGAPAEEPAEEETAAEETAEAEEPAEETSAEEVSEDGHDADAIAEVDGNTITVSNEWTGDDVDDKNKTRTAYMTNYLFDWSGTSGPMEMHIKGIEVSDIVFKDEATAGLAGVSTGSEAALIALYVTTENTSDEDLSFLVTQSVMITDTKEQVECAGFVSDDVGGDFYGNVKKEGYIYFFCKSSKAADLGHLTLRIDPPFDAELNDVGDPVAVEIDLVEK